MTDNFHSTETNQDEHLPPKKFRTGLLNSEFVEEVSIFHHPSHVHKSPPNALFPDITESSPQFLAIVLLHQF
jgi:hypothetical protein